MNPLDAELGLVERIVFGLGNPGQEYSKTRHNLGFRALDAFLKSEGIGKSFVAQKKARIQIVDFEGTKLMLAKPATYMNLSGDAVKSLLDATGLSTVDMLVIHDEMDIPAGRAKMKVGGSAAGHKGVQDIIDKCGEEFARIKIGIDRPPEPGENTAIDWVLGEPGIVDEEAYVKVMPLVAAAVRIWLVDGVEKAMTWFNSEFKEEPAAAGDEIILLGEEREPSPDNERE
jgi:PTH1 family peptidyl-tRNA hydrolase